MIDMISAKRVMRWLAGGTLGLAVAAGMATPGAAQVKSNLILGATASTSSHYAIAVAMARAIKDMNPNSSITVLETGASIDNIRRMLRQEVDFGIGAGDTTIAANQGIGPFDGKPVPDLVVIYTYDNTALNFVVRADSGINTLADLQGKKFHSGIRGSAAESLARGSLDVLGIKPDWVVGSLKDATEGVQNRQFVGYSKYSSVTVPDATIRELMTATPLKMLSFTPDQEKLVLSKIKGFDFVTLPDDIIPGQKGIRTPRIQTLYVGRQTQMNDDTAYAIAKAIHQKRQYLIEVFPHLKDYDFVNEALRVEQNGIKLHTGSKKYFLEAKAAAGKS